MKFIITIDTEEDNQWKQNGIVLTTENIKYIPRFQNLCDFYGFKPTYLCTYGVVKSQEFDKVLKNYQEQGKAEIGAHLHPWLNPPFENHSLKDFHNKPYPSELPLEIFRKKMETLTNIIYLKTGLKPKSYRAGRWGFCAEHISVLVELGYKVDCSISPLISWENTLGTKGGGPDFKKAPLVPYFLDFKNVCLKGKSTLLEVPPTVLYTNRFMKESIRFRNQFLKYRYTLVGRILNKVFSFEPQWFRPFPYMTAKKLKHIYIEATRQKLPVIEMILHSSELMPGASPYYSTSESVERLYNRLEKVFKFISKSNVKGVTLGKFAEEFC